MIRRKFFSNVLCCFFCFAPALASGGFSKVVIDAGHGGHDPGATVGLVYEKHLAFDVSRRVEAILRQQGVATVMTRNRDVYITLQERVRISNAQRDAIFVSIHFNSASNRGATGIETFYYSSNRDSYVLARFVQSAVLYKTKNLDRGVKHRGFHVLSNNKRPAILVECAFLSNSTDRSRSLNAAYRQRMAEGIAMGILRFKKS